MSEHAGMPRCNHASTTRVVDKLGMMTDDGFGRVSAPIIGWHDVCDGCGEVMAVHGEQPQPRRKAKMRLSADQIAYALGAGEGKRPVPDTSWVKLEEPKASGARALIRRALGRHG